MATAQMLYCKRTFLLIGLSVFVANCGVPPETDDLEATSLPLVTPIDPAKELVVKDLSVVDDAKRRLWTGGGGADGVWSASRLFYWAAGKKDPTGMMLGWLRSWERDQAINGRVSPARPDVRKVVINPWLAASGCATCPEGTADCTTSDNACLKLDYAKEPFRLLAIVNRIDLRNISNAGRRHSGEGRFVFGVLGLDAATGRQDRSLQFTAIFEYEMPGIDPPKVREWGRDWHQLSAKRWGNDYNNALTSMTDKWSRDNCKGKVNNSCLNQIRTNEFALDPARIWELREFRLDAATAQLRQTTLVQTPAGELNGSVELGDFINSNEAALLNGTAQIPTAMLAPSELTPTGLSWNAPNVVNPEARHRLGLLTCGGCHTGETGTFFTHVKPRAAGVEAKLSSFMTGVDPKTGAAVSPPDPFTGVPRSFNDIARRVEDLQFVLEATDAQLGGKPPKNAPH